MSNSNLTILKRYATGDPNSLPSSVLFQFSDKFMTIFDAYPKSIFHFLILPRVVEGGDFSAVELKNLKTLLKGDKEKAKQLVEAFQSEAQNVKKQIEEEMTERYGFKWDVWIGFHAVPSMEHLHLHVLSADMCSEKMKNKKHYNSFHPSKGFFLHINDVLDWFEATPGYYQQVTKLDPKAYEALLKEGLTCWKCGSEMKNIPSLKEHLQEEWNKQESRSRRTAAKRKVVEGHSGSNPKEKQANSGDEIPAKKRKGDPDLTQSND
ncbi:HIT-like protein [Coprinopsis marcescibilis]|uniref:HIT-like protein n=1 Tax=Coprinopsis marcescibilis TaxID=230819 RepID=A0A5C3LMD5_COPMA|nr:HIT-like protein [Coprinopsis marcescibilis]